MDSGQLLNSKMTISLLSLDITNNHKLFREGMELQQCPLKGNPKDEANKRQKSKLKENQLTHENCSNVLDTSMEAITDGVQRRRTNFLLNQYL